MSNTLFIGKVYFRFRDLPSTNEYAAALIAGAGPSKSRPPEGAVVRADNQTAGRGQFGSSWHSSPGQNLTLSVILYPNWLKIEAQFDLNMAIALALHDTCAVLNAVAPCTLKWPNDLYFGDRKCAGILIQNSISGKFLQTSIVGIGLNVNQVAFDSQLIRASSLALETGRQFDLDNLENSLLRCLESRYLQLKSGKMADLRAAYTERLFRLNEPGLYRRIADGQEFTGIVRGVAPDGRLRMEVDGAEVLFSLKEVGIV